jgi:hypothetical protein
VSKAALLVEAFHFLLETSHKYQRLHAEEFKEELLRLAALGADLRLSPRTQIPSF